ncbi:MAG: single-stranded DNA-binding protein [Campylobacterales bacterium]|jgi:single-strand DNA-binding protein
MFNKIILIGNLTRDVEIKYTQTGTPVAKFGLATNRRYRDRATGEQREETLFVDVTIFGRSAEVVHQFCRKGRRVLVEGRLAMDQWVAPDGTKRTKHYVIGEQVKFMDSRGEMELPQPPGAPLPSQGEPGRSFRGTQPELNPAGGTPYSTSQPGPSYPPEPHYRPEGSSSEGGANIPQISKDEDLPF